MLDQFSRNMFRDDAKAFASDALAVELAKHYPIGMRSPFKDVTLS